MRRGGRVPLPGAVTLLAAGLLSVLAAAEARARAVEARLGPVRATVTLEPDDPVIGDPLSLSIEALAEDGVEVLMPEFGEALDRFAIVDFVPRERVTPDGHTLLSQRYTLQAPASGEHILPSILIEFVDRRPGHDPAPAGQDAYELLTEALPFSVRSVVPDSARADLSPAMGALAARDASSRALWPIVLVTVLALAAAAPFVLRAWSRHRALRSQRTAYEIARGELDALLAGPRPLPDHSEQIDAFFVGLSGIVRRYLERRFALRAPELTTERFLEFVSASPDLTDVHRELLQDFLRQSDLVKFAHVVPSPQAIEQAVRFASEFLEETRDDPSTDGSPAAGAGRAAAQAEGV